MHNVKREVYDISPSDFMAVDFSDAVGDDNNERCWKLRL